MRQVVKIFDGLHWFVSRAVLAACKLMLYRQPANALDTIVVLRNCFFGDFVVAIPALRALRTAYPDARIVFLTATSFAPGWKDRVQNNSLFDIERGLIDEVVHYNSEDLRNPVNRAALRARIKCTGPAVSLALCCSADGLRSRLKRVLLCGLLGLPFPLGLTGARTLPAQRTLNRWRVERADVVHQYQAALGSVNELLCRLNRQIMPLDFAVRPALLARRPAPMLIGVAPFTKQPVKQWPLERFAAVMVQLAQETGAHFEVYGAPEECEMALQLDAMLRGRAAVTSLCGALTPAQLRQRLETVDLLIGLDSGPMHVASLVGTPAVAIFSQITLHQFWRPWGPGGELVSTKVPCAQCDTRSGACPLGTRACIDGISADAVLQRVRLLLVPTAREADA